MQDQTPTPTENRGIGDNVPPSDTERIQSALSDEFSALVRRRDELLEAASRAPETVGDDEKAGRFGDFVKQLTAAVKAAEAARVAEKEPYLVGGRAVDGFFKKITEPLAKVKAELESRLGTYLRAKEKAAREAREAEERKRQEEADRLAAEAAARAQAAEDEKGLEEAIAAEERANEAAEAAAKAKEAAEAKAAELSRTRGDYGSVGGLRERWTFRNLDRTKLDWPTLIPFISNDAVEKAIRAYIRSGGRDLDGCIIYAAKETAVR